MDIRDVALAVAAGSHWEQEGGSHEIRDLYPSVVLAVPKERHLQDTRISITVDLELLREDRMCDRNVRRRIAMVGYDDAVITHPFKKILEVCTYCLHRERVHRAVIALTAGHLDPNAAKELRVVVLQEIHEGVKEADCLGSVASRRACAEGPAQIGAFDFWQDAFEARTAAADEPRIEARFRLNERTGEVVEKPLVEHDASYDEDRRDVCVRGGSRQVLRIAGLVYVADSQATLKQLRPPAGGRRLCRVAP